MENISEYDTIFITIDTDGLEKRDCWIKNSDIDMLRKLPGFTYQPDMPGGTDRAAGGAGQIHRRGSEAFGRSDVDRQDRGRTEKCSAHRQAAAGRIKRLGHGAAEG